VCECGRHVYICRWYGGWYNCSQAPRGSKESRGEMYGIHRRMSSVSACGARTGSRGQRRRYREEKGNLQSPCPAQNGECSYSHVKVVQKEVREEEQEKVKSEHEERKKTQEEMRVRSLIRSPCGVLRGAIRFYSPPGGPGLYSGRATHAMRNKLQHEHQSRRLLVNNLGKDLLLRLDENNPHGRPS
jgi:hypothetical protein